MAKLSRELQSFQGDVYRAYQRGNRQIAEKTKKVAITFSSGPVSRQQLSKAPPGLNHPYGLGFSNARGPRGPIPYGTTAVINRQTGLFARSWTITTFNFAVPRLRLQNVAPYATYLDKGTQKMRKRELETILQAYVKQIGPRIYQTELQMAWNRRFRQGK